MSPDPLRSEGWRRRGDEAPRAAAERLRAVRLFALFLAGCLLFAPPALGFFSQPRLVLGVPVLVVYVFVAWTALIALVALFTEGGPHGGGR
ncbi:MAG: hypothetical protein AAFX50_13050 [Acidobacteriota bacterium]